MKAVVERAERGETQVAREHYYDAVADVVRRKVDKTHGRISAKRLLPVAVAEGYEGWDRNFRRLVTEAKADYRRRHGRRSARAGEPPVFRNPQLWPTGSPASRSPPGYCGA